MTNIHHTIIQELQKHNKTIIGMNKHQKIYINIEQYENHCTIYEAPAPGGAWMTVGTLSPTDNGFTLTLLTKAHNTHTTSQSYDFENPNFPNNMTTAIIKATIKASIRHREEHNQAWNQRKCK